MFWTSGVATIITASLGIVGNLLSILVLCKKVMSSMFHNLLLFLCMADLVFLLSSLAMSLAYTLQYYNLYPSYTYHAYECVCHVTLAVSVWITASITIERHQVIIKYLSSALLQSCLQAVCLPHVYRSRLASTGQKRLITYDVLPAVLLAFLLNIPRLITKENRK